MDTNLHESEFIRVDSCPFVAKSSFVFLFVPLRGQLSTLDPPGEAGGDGVIIGLFGDAEVYAGVDLEIFANEI